jgi:ketosteroid isomerase-like protein
MPAPAEVQLATLKRFITGWSNWSAAEMVETWTDDCLQVTLPTTLHHPPRDRTQVLGVLPLVQKVVTEYEVRPGVCAMLAAALLITLPQLTIRETVHDAAKNKAAVYAVSKANTPFGPWTNEYAVFFTFDESGERIARIEEFVDSAFLNDFFPKFQGYLQEQQQQ